MNAGIFKESPSAHSEHGLYVFRSVSNYRVALKMPTPIVFVVVLHSLYLLASPRALFGNARPHCVCALVLCFVFLFIYPKGGRPKRTLLLNGLQNMVRRNLQALGKMCRNLRFVVETLA